MAANGRTPHARMPHTNAQLTSKGKNHDRPISVTIRKAAQ